MSRDAHQPWEAPGPASPVERVGACFQQQAEDVCCCLALRGEGCGTGCHVEQGAAIAVRAVARDWCVGFQ